MWEDKRDCRNQKKDSAGLLTSPVFTLNQLVLHPFLPTPA